MPLPLAHPLLVLPGIVQFPGDGRGKGPHLPKIRIWISLVEGLSVCADYMVFIGLAPGDIRDKAFPDARTFQAYEQGMRPGVPVVEMTDDRNIGGIGRPYGE